MNSVGSRENNTKMKQKMWVITLDPSAQEGCQFCCRDCILWQIRKGLSSSAKGRGGTALYRVSFLLAGGITEHSLKICPLTSAEGSAGRIFGSVDRKGTQTLPECQGRAYQFSFSQAQVPQGVGIRLLRKYIVPGHETGQVCVAPNMKWLNRNTSSDAPLVPTSVSLPFSILLPSIFTLARTEADCSFISLPSSHPSSWLQHSPHGRRPCELGPPGLPSLHLRSR